MGTCCLKSICILRPSQPSLRYLARWRREPLWCSELISWQALSMSTWSRALLFFKLWSHFQSTVSISSYGFCQGYFGFFDCCCSNFWNSILHFNLSASRLASYISSSSSKIILSIGMLSRCLVSLSEGCLSSGANSDKILCLSWMDIRLWLVCRSSEVGLSLYLSQVEESSQFLKTTELLQWTWREDL